jgi:hypothetical protein
MSGVRHRCYRCGERLLLDEFYRDKTKSSGRRSICKSCDKETSRENYVAVGRERLRVPLTEHTCATCGGTFSARADAKTCSRECRSRLAYLRRKIPTASKGRL